MMKPWSLFVVALVVVVGVVGAFPTPDEEIAEFRVEGLAFRDWIKAIEDKIDEVISKGKEIGSIAVGKLEEIGRDAFDKLVEATGNAEDAFDRFVQEVLPRLISKASSVAEAGKEGLNKVADAVVRVLRKLGSKALEAAAKWVKENEDQIGKDLGEAIVDKIEEIGFEIAVAEFGIVDSAVDYLKQKLMELGRLAYEEALVLADKIVYALKTYGIPALKAALDYVQVMKCELGEMIYKMLFNKINAAMGIEFGILEYDLQDWLESVGKKIGDLIEAGKENAKDLIESIKSAGQDALDKLVEATGSLKKAKEQFISQVLPKILDKLKGLKEKGEAAMNVAIDALVVLLKRLGLAALEKAIAWIDANKEELGDKLYNKIILAIQNAIIDISLGSNYGMVETGEIKMAMEIEFGVAIEYDLQDWLDSIGKKIGDLIESGKENAKDLIESIKSAGQDALDKLVEATGSLKKAKEQFISQVLPKILAKLKGLKEKGEAAMNVAIDALVVLLKRLGLVALEKAINWIDENREELGEKLYLKIILAIQNAIFDIALGSPYGMMETAEEYLEESLAKLARAGLDAAEYLVDKMIAFLKVFGVSALKMAERLIEANKCLVGAYVFNMAMGKVKTAIKAAAIGGIVG